jgi:nucleoside-diphosphate-sugar epimerase
MCSRCLRPRSVSSTGCIVIQTVLVTGASGFIGRSVTGALLRCGNVVVGLVRQPSNLEPGVQEWIVEPDDFRSLSTAWPDSLRCDTVIHLAARVHLLDDTAADPLAAYRETNVAATLRVAEAARCAGARRFVFVSSVKAIAEADPGHPLTESDKPDPRDPYGVSKLEAERALSVYGRESGLEVVIVRPPLVYGPGVRANFLRLMNAIAKGVPLPLGAIDSRRSLLFVENLADALVLCATDPRAAGQTFHVTDGDDQSVAELARALAVQLGAPNRLLPVPVGVLRLAGRLTGRSMQVDRLIGELRLDISHIRHILDWHPPHTVEVGLRKTVAWYRSAR